MRPSVNADRWVALRALRAGEPPTFSRLAAIAGLNAATIRERAAREDWPKCDFRNRAVRESWAGRAAPAAEPATEAVTAEAARLIADLSPAEALERLKSLIARQVAEIVATAEASGRAPDKARIDALDALMRLAERALALKVPGPGREEQEETEEEEQRAAEDAELADKFRLIDEKIAELAEARAEWLVAERDRAGPG